MRRNYVWRGTSRSSVPTMEEPNLEEQRLDLNNIVQLDPWKKADKYDKQEVGQIQKYLEKFNSMVVENKKNKRRSVGKSRAPTLSTKTQSGNEGPEEGSMKRETIKNDKNQRGKSESSASITIRENVATDETSDIRNTKEKSIDKNEDELEGKKEKSFKSQNHVELNVPLNDKKDKRKSVEKRRSSTSSTKVTGSNTDLEEKTMKTQKIKNDKRQSFISESSVNDPNIDILENVSTTNTSHNQNIKGKPLKKNEDQSEKKKEKSSKSRNPVEIDVELNDKNNKRKSVGKSRASTSSTKANGSNAGFEDKTKKTEKMRNDDIQHWISESSVNDATINVPENIATKNTSGNQNTVDKKRKEIREENKDPSSKVINRVGRRSLGKRLNSSSAMQTIDSNHCTEGQSTMNKGKFQYWLHTSDGAGSIADIEENIGTDHNRGNINIESFEKEKSCTQKLEEIRGNTFSEAVVEKIVIADDTITARMQEISKFVFPAPTNDKESYMETPELHSDEPSCNDNLVNNESIISGHLRNQSFQVFSSANTIEKLESDSENRTNNVSNRDANSAKQSSTMKPRSVSAEPEKNIFPKYTDYKHESKNTLHPGTEKIYVLKKEPEHSVKQSSTIKARSASAEPDYEKFVVCNNNEFESKNAKKREEKIAKAFEKFGKKFTKYSNRIEQPQNYKTGPNEQPNVNDVTLDSESDSSSSDSSRSSSSDSDESSSSEHSYSSGTCSCCSGSSSDLYDRSYSDSTSCSSFCCCSCRSIDMYSEYTLASSSSTHPGSDDSTDSSTD